MPTLSIIEASTSGHTSFVIDTIVSALGKFHPGLQIKRTRAEKATVSDLRDCDLLMLGSGTWNTGGKEGQLNPHMHELLFDRAKDIDLKGTPVALISLGDDRYYFTTRCTEHFMRWIKQCKGKPIGMPLIIVNEPYDQVEKIEGWAGRLHEAIAKKPL